MTAPVKPGLRTRKPSGRVPWPLILVEGAEKLPDRFWAKVDFEGPTHLDTPCWVWTGADTGGNRPYGVSWDGQRRVKAHRWAWTTADGPIPHGLEVDHLCRMTLCVRKSHMEIVTKTENVMRSNAPGPRAVRENTCKRGHAFTPENTIVRSERHRECRTCARANSRAGKARRRLAKRAAA